jgi:hypothetical protein
VADIDFRKLGEDLVDSVQAQFKEFLEENPEIAQFVGRLGRRYAELAAQYHLGDGPSRDEALSDLRRVRNSIDLEMDAIAHEAPSALLGQLKAALGVVLNFAIQNLPTIIAMVRR